MKTSTTSMSSKPVNAAVMPTARLAAALAARLTALAARLTLLVLLVLLGLVFGQDLVERLAHPVVDPEELHLVALGLAVVGEREAGLAGRQRARHALVGVVGGVDGHHRRPALGVHARQPEQQRRHPGAGHHGSGGE